MNKDMDVQIRKSFQRAKKDVAQINVKVACKRAQIVEVEERTNPHAARKPRRSVDLISASNVDVQMVAPSSNNKSSDNAPTHHQVDVSFNEIVKSPNNEGTTVPSNSNSNKPPSSRRINWRFCFDTQDNLMDFLSIAHNILDEGGQFKAKDVDRFEHQFEVADHIYRWEMIVCPPVVYPIQIHGIVLSAGRNCLVIADFGLTGYGRKEGDDFNFADDRHQNVILGAWRKIRPKDENQRLNIVTLTTREEIQKWSKAHYDEARKRKIESVKKITGLMSKLNVLKFDKDSSSKFDKDSSYKSLKPDGDAANSEVTEATAASSTTPIEHEELPKSDPSDIVLARANYLLEHEHVLPSYHVFFSNSECIAVWCKTGRWSTLQTAVFLASNSFGGAKGATLATLGMAAAHVLLVPVVAVGGLIWVSAPMMVLNRSKEKWDEYTMKLTKLFWEWAPPAMYVSAIENWGGILPSTENDGTTMEMTLES
eukprot:scaffold30576_cov52-Attheya_sp.AAC.4